MSETLLSAVRRFADLHADADGVARASLEGVTVVRATHPGELQYAISRPLVAIIVQGCKRVSMGSRAVDLVAGDSMLITADVPTVSQITRASAGEPYYSVVINLEPAIIDSLVTRATTHTATPPQALYVAPTDGEVAETCTRMMRLLEQPAALDILGDQYLRELHYWLLAGRHGHAIRGLGAVDGSLQRVARAVALIRSDYAQPLRVEKLAEVAGMSASTFHHHFRAVTSLSPLQFQKQLRLIEARRMMLSEGKSSSNAAYAVGYESVPQFTREYGRLFGAPPARDIKSALARVQAMA
ncbi:AraC family transcriptional regulator N-terminal domain-containing protein [Pseudoxanthomonas mexicana]